MQRTLLSSGGCINLQHPTGLHSIISVSSSFWKPHYLSWLGWKVAGGHGEEGLEVSSHRLSLATYPAAVSSALCMPSPGMNIHEPSYCRHLKLPAKVHTMKKVYCGRWVKITCSENCS